MPQHLADTILLPFAVFTGVILLIIGTMVIGVTCSTMAPIGIDNGVGSDTTPFYNFFPQVIGIVCIICGIVAPVVAYFLGAFRKEPEQYYRYQQ